jgi:hypothetical protein
LCCRAPELCRERCRRRAIHIVNRRDMKLFAAANLSFGGSIFHSARHIRTHATYANEANVHEAM